MVYWLCVEEAANILMTDGGVEMTDSHSYKLCHPHCQIFNESAYKNSRITAHIISIIQ